MKNIELVVPDLKKYYYEKKLNEDPETMSYNAGYDVSYDGYNYDDGTILFLEINGRRLILEDRIVIGILLILKIL